MNNIPFRVVKGLNEAILDKPINEGYVYFATDTKKIYLDTTDSRLSMGGNTGIYYGYADFTGEEGPEFIFSIMDFIGEDAASIPELPNVKDLIINSDGAFYKVIERRDDSFITERILVSGTGGGSGEDTGLGTMYFAVDSATNRTILPGQDLILNLMLAAQNDLGENSGNGRYEVYIDSIKKTAGSLNNSGDISNPGLTQINIGEFFTLPGTYKVDIKAYAYTGGATEASRSRRINVTVTQFGIIWNYKTEENINSVTKDFKTSWVVTGDA